MLAGLACVPISCQESKAERMPCPDFTSEGDKGDLPRVVDGTAPASLLGVGGTSLEMSMLLSELIGSPLGTTKLSVDRLPWATLASMFIEVDWGFLEEGEQVRVAIDFGSLLGGLSKMKCPLAALAGLGE